MISALLWLINTAVFLYIAVILVMMMMTWLVAFKIADPQRPVIAQIDRALFAITNPLVNPVRRIVPAISGVDLSPVVVVLLLAFLDHLINGLMAAAPVAA